jgi:outer membrane protein, multidrug efflux system
VRPLALLFLVAAACASVPSVGPDYKRPAVDAPATYRGAPEANAGASLGDEDWERVFPDPALAALLREAVANNQDVLIAVARIEQAGAQLGITRADQLPSVSAGIAGGRERLPASGPLPPITTNVLQGSATLSWQLDFWGKFRRASEAARADLLGAEWNRRAVITSLVAAVASGYYQLLELDLELEISRRTLASRKESLELTQLQERHGTVSILDVRQAEQLVYNAGETIIDLERRREQQENLLSTFLGRNPGSITRGRRLTEQPHDPVVPAGVPSDVLQRRPDIQLEEARLVSANARIGVARSAFFPSISLTASGGVQSAALSDLFKGPAGAWSFIGSLTQPIFAGGKLRAGVKLAEAQEKEALLAYQQTIQRAFREVSDALVAYQKDRQFREQQALLSDSTRDALALSEQRYRGGAASYLEVLDANTRTFAAELGVAQAQLNELLALVQLYAALGGGWQAAQENG